MKKSVRVCKTATADSHIFYIYNAVSKKICIFAV